MRCRILFVFKLKGQKCNTSPLQEKRALGHAQRPEVGVIYSWLIEVRGGEKQIEAETRALGHPCI